MKHHHAPSFQDSHFQEFINDRKKDSDIEDDDVDFLDTDEGIVNERHNTFTQKQMLSGKQLTSDIIITTQ